MYLFIYFFVFIFKDNTLAVFKAQKNQEGHPFLTSGATSDNGLEIFYICLRAKGEDSLSLLLLNIHVIYVYIHVYIHI